MPRAKKYDNYTAEALIDAEMEICQEFDRENKLTDKSPAEMETTGPETKNGTIVNTVHVNVRKEPTLVTNNVIEILRQGDKVKILDKVGDFYKVSTSTNNNGYIFSQYVKEE